MAKTYKEQIAEIGRQARSLHATYGKKPTAARTPSPMERQAMQAATGKLTSAIVRISEVQDDVNRAACGVTPQTRELDKVCGIRKRHAGGEPTRADCGQWSRALAAVLKDLQTVRFAVDR